MVPPARRGGAPDADLAPLVDQPWETRTHRQVLAELVLSGWTLCGVGDMAVALRSPDGLLAARVCPFDPAHPPFVELCRRCVSNPYLPQIALAVDLDGGGLLTVMEFLAPVNEAVASDVTRRWREDDGDTELATLRREALAVDTEYGASTPWWDGIDLNEGNVRRSDSGHIRVIDLFCIDGSALYAQIVQDPSVVRQRMPENQRRHLLDIPYLARESSVEKLRALRHAMGR